MNGRAWYLLGIVVGIASLTLWDLAQGYLTVGYGLHPVACGAGIATLLCIGWSISGDYS